MQERNATPELILGSDPRSLKQSCGPLRQDCRELSSMNDHIDKLIRYEYIPIRNL